jgi:hypothetical protein
MGRPYSLDLRERVVAAVIAGMSAARRRSTSVSASRRHCAGPDGCDKPAALRQNRWAASAPSRSLPLVNGLLRG